MNSEGPSRFLKRPKSASSLGFSTATSKPAKIAAIRQYIMAQGSQTLKAIAKEDIPDACTVQEWLENGSINRKLLEMLKNKNAKLRRSRKTTVISLPSRMHTSLTNLPELHRNQGLVDGCGGQPSCNTLRDAKAASEPGFGWPQKSFKTFNRWWLNGWWFIGQFILHCAGALLKNRKIDIY